MKTVKIIILTGTLFTLLWSGYNILEFAPGVIGWLFLFTISLVVAFLMLIPTPKVRGYDDKPYSREDFKSQVDRIRKNKSN